MKYVNTMTFVILMYRKLGNMPKNVPIKRKGN